MIAPRLRAPFLARWHRAHSRQPVLRIVLAAAVLVPLATAALAAWRSWENVWREARGEVTRSA